MDVSPIERRFDYRDTIRVSPSDLDLAATGTKTLTVRVGTLGVSKTSMSLSDGWRILAITVTAVDSTRTLKDLTDTEAIADGHETIDDLRRELESYYGPLASDQNITVIHFTSTGEPPAPRRSAV